MRTNQIERVNGSSREGESRRAISDNMDAIAHGVQVRLDEKTSFSQRVTDETVITARALGVADSVIEKWAARRLNRLVQDTERLREIRALLEQCYQGKPDMTAGQRA